MIRTQIYLTEHQMKVLKELPNQEEFKMSEIIRRAIDEYIEKYKVK